MWDAWTAAIADAAADSPEVMPWEKPAQATVITAESAHRAMVRVLESITGIEARRQIRDILALEREFTEPEGTEGIRRTCQYQPCGRLYRGQIITVPVLFGQSSPGSVQQAQARSRTRP